MRGSSHVMMDRSDLGIPCCASGLMNIRDDCGVVTEKDGHREARDAEAISLQTLCVRHEIATSPCSSR
jgi:hypothetical protein